MISNFYKRIITSFFLILLLFFGLFYNELSWKVLVLFFLVLCFYEFYYLLNKIFNNRIIFIILTLICVFYLYIFYFLLIKIKIELGEEFILVLIFTCVFSDVGGYIFGKLIGGPKLTSISPNKTISGSFGSIIFTVLGTYTFVLFLNKIDLETISFQFSISFVLWLILMSVCCQIGDLLVSYLKRKAKVKDTGNLLPGHGGILDRVDGILFAIPFGILAHFVIGGIK